MASATARGCLAGLPTTGQRSVFAMKLGNTIGT